MRLFGRGDDELGKRIGANRAEPPDDLVERLSRMADPSPGPRARARTAIALGMSTIVLALGAAFGGASATIAAASTVVTTVQNVISPPAAPPAGDPAGAAKNQYCAGDTDRDFKGSNSSGKKDPDKDGDIDHCG